MAKAPNDSTRKKTPRSQAAVESGSPVEDAVVIDETSAENPHIAEPSPEAPVIEAENSGSDNPPDAVVPDAPIEEPEKSQTEPEAAKAAASAPVRSRSGIAAFIGFLLGGVAAAAIGFGAARYIVPEGWPFPGVPLEEDPVAAAVAVQGTEIAALSEKIDGLGASVAALQSDTALATLEAGLTGRFDVLGESLTALTARLDGIESRLAGVEKLAPEGSAAAQMAAEAYARELAALREMFASELEKVEAAQSEAAALQAQAAIAAQAAAGRAALARITAALDTGQPFDDALQDLSASTGIAAPEALAGLASEGVPTLAALQEAFPQAARAALDASVRAAVDAGDESRLGAFLQTQLGARSLEPKEGDDADAVLSRSEAALRQGDLGAALVELDALPDAGQPAMADWRTLAATRKAALDAGAALAQELNPK